MTGRTGDRSLSLSPTLPSPASLRLLVAGVLTAAATELAELQSIRGRLLIFSGNVVTTLTLVTLKHNIVAWHFS